MPWLRLLAHGAGGAARYPGDHGVRRPPRAAQATRGSRPRRHLWQRAGDVLPDRLCPGIILGSAAGAAGGCGAGPRGPGPRRSGRARSRHQHQALPAVRAQLRIPLRGPGPLRRPGRGDDPRHPEPGCGCLPQALCRQQPGDRPAAGQRRGRRADPSRDLPRRLRARCHQGAAMDGDVRLQQGQRGVRLPERPVAHHHPAGRVGLRRPGRLRLGRGARPSRRPRGRVGPGDAAQPRCQ